MDRLPDLTKSQLFLDDLWIDDQHKLTRLWHAADIYSEPVLRAEKPWEGMNVSVSLVMKSGDHWKMYYSTSSPKRPLRVNGMDVRNAQCVAESEDGMQWERPSLGLVEFQGSKQNNILPYDKDTGATIDFSNVCYDPEDEEAPFKRTYLDKTGIRGSISRDGYYWTELEKPLITRSRTGDVQSLWFNKVDGRYIIIHKVEANRSRRTQWIAESEDFRTFSDSRLIMKADLIDPPDVEYYRMKGFPYADLYLAMADRYINVPDHAAPLLTWSHDRKTWYRPIARESFLAPTYDWNQASGIP